MTMQDVEFAIYKLRDLGVLREQETEALDAAAMIIANLRVFNGYDPKNTTPEDVMKMMYRYMV